MSGAVKLLLVIVALAGIGALVWLTAPLFYDTKVNESLPGEVSAAGSVVSAEGTFRGADQFHQAAGTARLLEADGKTYVRFEDDFAVTNGPDLFVYLGNNGEYDADTNLGALKGSKGSQNYEVPAGIDVSQYSEVWVWCRAFAVPFGSAQLAR
jgi:hypothetical protein